MAYRHATLCSPSERNSVVEGNLGLIGHALHRLHAWEIAALGGWDDAFQIGIFGLMRAAELYDPARESTTRKPGAHAGFASYAAMAILRHCRNSLSTALPIPIPRYVWLRRWRTKEFVPAVQQWPEIDLTTSAYEGDAETATHDPVAPPEPDPHEHDDLAAAVATLPLRARAMLRQRFTGGASFETIGARTGVSGTAINERMAKVLKKLRELMEARAA